MTCSLKQNLDMENENVGNLAQRRQTHSELSRADEASRIPLKILLIRDLHVNMREAPHATRSRGLQWEYVLFCELVPIFDVLFSRHGAIVLQ